MFVVILTLLTLFEIIFSINSNEKKEKIQNFDYIPGLNSRYNQGFVFEDSYDMNLSIEEKLGLIQSLDMPIEDYKKEIENLSTKFVSTSDNTLEKKDDLQKQATIIEHNEEDPDLTELFMLIEKNFSSNEIKLFTNDKSFKFDKSEKKHKKISKRKNKIDKKSKKETNKLIKSKKERKNFTLSSADKNKINKADLNTNRSFLKKLKTNGTLACNNHDTNSLKRSAMIDNCSGTVKISKVLTDLNETNPHISDDSKIILLIEKSTLILSDRNCIGNQFNNFYEFVAKDQNFIETDTSEIITNFFNDLIFQEVIKRKFNNLTNLIKSLTTKNEDRIRFNLYLSNVFVEKIDNYMENFFNLHNNLDFSKDFEKFFYDQINFFRNENNKQSEKRDYIINDINKIERWFAENISAEYEYENFKLFILTNIETIDMTLSNHELYFLRNKLLLNSQF
ncbi:hypothetical protein GVAV_000430 [Gurleya vavrai]